MKNKYLFLNIVLIGCCFVSLKCNNPTQRDQPVQTSKTKEVLEKERVLKIAEEIAFREYGDIIKKELPLTAQLIGDSVWVIQGTLIKGADGGTVYIELRRSNDELLKITHYK